MENPDFKGLKDVFERLVNQYRDDVSGRALRVAGAAGKAAADSSLQEFPKSFVTQVARDIYSAISSQEVADSISSTVSSFDEEKVKDMLDQAVAQLKDPESAKKIAGQLKDLLNKTSIDDLELQLDGLMGGADQNQRILFQVFFQQIKPILQDMKGATDEEVAQKLSDLADQIPTDLIAAQVASFTREVTPERVSQRAHDAIGQLPSPQAVADMLHGIGAEASRQFDRLSKVSTAGEATKILADFAENSRDVVEKTLQQDTAAKKTFKPKGGSDFEL